jgi:hypothetical protein
MALSIPQSAGADVITFTQISTTFNNPVGIDHHTPTNSVVMSVNYPSGFPSNFERVNFDGTHSPFSSASLFSDEVKIATAKTTIGGFTAGELFTGNGVDGQVVRISADGSTVQSPWVSLPGAGNGLMRGSLFVDDTGVYGNDLIVATTAGEVWRIDGSAAADCSVGCTMLADVNVHLEGLLVVPNDATAWGSLAGKVIAGAEGSGLMYVFDNGGFVETKLLSLGGDPINIEDIDLIPSGQNFFGVNFGTSRLLGVPASGFASSAGHILLTEEFFDSTGGKTGLWEFYWDPLLAAFVVDPFIRSGGELPGQWEHVTFSTAGIREIPPVVPEPLTLTLLTIGAAGFRLRRRLRK